MARGGRGRPGRPDPAVVEHNLRMRAGLAVWPIGSEIGARAHGSPKPLGKRPLSGELAPLADSRLGTRVPVAALFVRDPDHALATFARLHGLTRKEAEVTARLALGEDLRWVAAALGVSVNTARTHVYRLFDSSACVARPSW